MKHLIRWLANLGYLIAGVLFLPIAFYRMVCERRYLRGWRNRLGLVPERNTDRPAIWVHAVSMGEVNAAKPLIEKLRQQIPFHDIFVSTNTDTGYNRAISLFDPGHVFFSPFDFSFTIETALNRIKPSLILLMELEVWPNMLSLAKDRNIPVVVVNGRVTERSAHRYGLLGPIVRWIFRHLRLVLAQDDIYAKRFAKLGVSAQKLIVSGSLKWDGATITDSVPSKDELARAVGIDPNKRLLVAGQTGDDLEEETVIRCYHQLRSRWNDLQLAIIPRKPERFDHVARLISARGFHAVRRSNHPDGSQGPEHMVAGKPVVVLGDTMGELRKFYNLATITFVGRTLVPMGGSDVMEVAALGKPIVVGPHGFNFADAIQKLISAGAAVQVDVPEKLATVIGEILADPARLEAMSNSARDVVISNQGATAKTASAICDILGMEYDQTEQGVALPKMK
jgi:3-deoxy-D-manno-octulosonic-acid transferase